MNEGLAALVGAGACSAMLYCPYPSTLHLSSHILSYITSFFLSCPAQILDYGVPESNVLGIRFGFQGFYSKEHKPVTLSRR